MAFFDKLGEMTKIVSEKANDSLATNNLISEINLTKGNIQALQRELGEHYWAKFAVGEKLDAPQQDSHRCCHERAAGCPPPLFAAWAATGF